MKTYRLGSNNAIFAPAIVRWAVNGAKFEKDRAAMARVISQGWNVPRDAALALVTGQVPYTIENETVVFAA
jgi:hypothetical protein